MARKQYPIIEHSIEEQLLTFEGIQLGTIDDGKHKRLPTRSQCDLYIAYVIRLLSIIQKKQGLNAPFQTGIWFTAPESYLKDFINLDRRTMVKDREVLKDAGYIDFEKGKIFSKGKTEKDKVPAYYVIHPLFGAKSISYINVLDSKNNSYKNVLDNTKSNSYKNVLDVENYLVQKCTYLKKKKNFFFEVIREDFMKIEDAEIQERIKTNLDADCMIWCKFFLENFDGDLDLSTLESFARTFFEGLKKYTQEQIMQIINNMMTAKKKYRLPNFDKQAEVLGIKTEKKHSLKSDTTITDEDKQKYKERKAKQNDNK